MFESGSHWTSNIQGAVLSHKAAEKRPSWLNLTACAPLTIQHLDAWAQAPALYLSAKAWFLSCLQLPPCTLIASSSPFQMSQSKDELKASGFMVSTDLNQALEVI